VGVFCSPLSQEYYLAAQHFGLGKVDLIELCEGVVEIIFGGEQDKVRLRNMYLALKE
jgi:adenosine deaminase